MHGIKKILKYAFLCPPCTSFVPSTGALPPFCKPLFKTIGLSKQIPCCAHDLAVIYSV